MPSLVAQKRDGCPLSDEEWRQLVARFTAGDLPDYQMAALLMAAYLNGLDGAELASLTGAMLDSGDRLPPSGHDPWIDKHSTGGVGDKVSLVLAPLVAACGVGVPMMAGRSLGHTGGTIDKLECIPGFRTALTLAEAAAQMERIGCALFGATGEIAPADRKLYALRDATSTVEAIPLMAASILSKKLAEGVSGLVFDVKRGGGAFLPELDDALQLASTLVRLAESHDCPAVALVTAMDRPLGRAVGNALETEEAILALRGEGPADLIEVTLALGVEMLRLAGAEADAAAARARLETALADGTAAAKLREIVHAQGGDPAVVDDPTELPHAPVHLVFPAPRTGTVEEVAARPLGEAVRAMGGGRYALTDVIDPGVGLVITARPGDQVEADHPLASVFAADDDGAELGLRALAEAVRIGDGPADPLPLVSHRVTAKGVVTLDQSGFGAPGPQSGS